MQKIRTYLQLARPHQYLKNGFIWLPAFFSNRLHDPQTLHYSLWAFIVFCFGASSIYIVNDIKDVEEDRQHPEKKKRPLASGELSNKEAYLLFVGLFFSSVILSTLFLPYAFLLILCIYLTLNFCYSFFLKRISIIDIFCIATGFVLRVFAGGTAAGINISHWIIIMTFLLALFLGLAKRRDDIILASDGFDVRTSISGYNKEFISLGMVFMASVIVVAYLLYTVSPEVCEKYGTNNLFLTGFWVILGVLRYMQITFVEQKSGAPTKVLMKDPFLQTVIILWMVSFYMFIYVF